MTEGAAKRRQGGGRPLVLMLVLLVQTSAAMFFVTDTLSEMSENGIAAHQWFEGLVTLALILGVGLGALELRRAMAHQQMQDKALATAGGEMDRVIREQFQAWRLTPAERDVGYLALKGLDAPEIAAIRHAAAGTVRAQLSGIYAKAGTTSRAQFAALFVEDLLADGLPTGAARSPVPHNRV